MLKIEGKITYSFGFGKADGGIAIIRPKFLDKRIRDVFAKIGLDFGHSAAKRKLRGGRQRQGSK
jgi:hypothetical protein